jgi:hypothetical protein
VTKIIGVFPPVALTERSRLFGALGAAFRVRFEGRERGAWDGIDAVIIVGALPHDIPEVPVLRYVHAEDVAGTSPGTALVDLVADSAVDARLRGRRLTESALLTASERLKGGLPLAHDEGGTVWARDEIRVLQTCVVAPSELAPDEPLRKRFLPGRFLALLPLIQLLRGVVEYENWSRPPVRAAYLFDDPNLHWRSYGHIRFAELAAHARLHGYHVAFGTIPLDCWYAHPGTVRTLRSAKSCLSLSLHGNDHLFQEFAQPRTRTDSVAVVTQALGRILGFEDRTGLSVDRVMVPPHGLCSDEMLNALLSVRIEALCRAPGWWSNWPPDRSRTADWHMADIAPGGGPIIRRHPVLNPAAREDAVLSAFLDQPVVLYGHHYDVSAGYDGLAETAEWLRGVGQVAWQSLAGLARSNYESRSEPDGVLRIRSYSRTFSVKVPEDVRKIVVEMTPYEEIGLDRLLVRSSEYELAVANGVAVAEIPSTSPGQLELSLERRVDAPSASPRTVNPRAVTRRAVAETRDRLQPLVERAGLNPLLRKLELAYNRRMHARAREQARGSE